MSKNSVGDLFILGITGPTGSGKTLVSDLFAKQGINIIDADKLSRVVVEPGKPCLAELANEFSDDIIFADGSLNRKKLAEIAFSSPEKTVRLGEIVHPYVIDESYKILAKLASNGETIAVIDAPLLFESDMDKICDHVLVVIAPRESRLERIMSRDNISKDDVLRRINAQKEDFYYISRADSILSNDEGMDKLSCDAIDFLENLRKS